MEYFSIVAKWISEKTAQSIVGFAAFLIVLVWAIAGLPLHFSLTWHLSIGTIAAVISIIMLFIIQNTEHRHTIAIQLKLDEIIRATKGAHNEMMDIEKLTDEDLARIQKRYGLLAEKTREDLKNGKIDTHTPDIVKVTADEKRIVWLDFQYQNLSVSTLADHAFAPSESVMQIMKDRGVMSAINVVPTGIYTEQFARRDRKTLCKKLNIPADAFVAGHVGRLASEKNLEFLLNSVGVG